MTRLPAPEAPVFHPTLHDVNSMTFVEYVERVVEKSKAFREAGICRIVAPDGWAPRKTGYNRLNFELPRPIRQHATGRAGLYRTLLVESKAMPLGDFRDMAREAINAAPKAEEGKEPNPDELERQFWRNVTLNPPLYGADVPGSLFDPETKGWTLRRLRSLLSDTLNEHGFRMPGVNEPYLYVGSWRSVFAWHTEDMDLHSVNYLHTGANKQWYVVPPAHRARFEQLMRSLLPDLFRACPEFMRHKELLVSPQLLASHAIPVVRVVHHPREFVVVGPGAYHSGFNHGFNIAESVNFATKAWLPVGAAAGYCECQADSARIDMRLFARHMTPALRREVQEMYATSDDEEEEEEEEGSEDDSSTAGVFTAL
jgi:jumonji domain-containing protein 2